MMGCVGMNSENIKSFANQLILTYGTCDPFFLAQELGIIVEYKDIGSLKGLYFNMNDFKCIVINTEVDSVTARVVCAHEIGHSQLHQGQGASFFNDYDLDTKKQKASREIEANLFTAELLISDEDFIEMARNKYTLSQIAIKHGVHDEIVILKAKNLNAGGEQFNIPFETKSDYLSKI